MHERGCSCKLLIGRYLVYIFVCTRHFFCVR
uniref:Uncharacterized protein n=1 Tax=Anguilla anguilla TaxID=7936 RepID=A0A0E9SVJ2_ANGAN